jgi:putative hydrolase of the HAD superfamily
VTNGASCWQREKLRASALADRFDAIVVSGELGTAKPDPAVYAHALRALGAEPGDAAMVGDSLRNDVDGALAAGLGAAIWVNRDGKARPADRPDLREIAGLDELPAALA